MLNKLLFTLGLTTSLIIFTGSEARDVSDKILKHLSKFIKEKPSEIKESPIPGLYAVLYGTKLFYVSKDGRYAFQGSQMIDLVNRSDVSDKIISKARKIILDKVSEKDMIVYTPKKIKHTITVFTDIDCSYCQILHEGRKKLLDNGIKIRYLFYPRAGLNSESFKTAESVWCAKNRQEALTKAKSIASDNSKIGQRFSKGEDKHKPQVSSPKCETPIKMHMAKLHELGLEEATPQILLKNGRLFGGYLSPDKLIRILEHESK